MPCHLGQASITNDLHGGSRRTVDCLGLPPDNHNTMKKGIHCDTIRGIEPEAMASQPAPIFSNNKPRAAQAPRHARIIWFEFTCFLTNSPALIFSHYPPLPSSDGMLLDGTGARHCIARQLVSAATYASKVSIVNPDYPFKLFALRA